MKEEEDKLEEELQKAGEEGCQYEGHLQPSSDTEMRIKMVQVAHPA